jgi:ribosome-associated protein
MNDDIYLQSGIIIPAHELEITTSRSGGPGGQHVNKADTRVTIRWNVKKSHALRDDQKELILQKLHSSLTTEGELLVTNGASRSQQLNKKAARETLANKVRAALHVPRKRTATKTPHGAREARFKSKKHRGTLKALRRKTYRDDE